MTRTLLRGVERAILAHVNSGSRGCPREPPSCPPSKENASAELRQSQQAGPEPVAPGDTGGETPGRRSPADQLLLPGGDRRATEPIGGRLSSGSPGERARSSIRSLSAFRIAPTCSSTTRQVPTACGAGEIGAPCASHSHPEQPSSATQKIPPRRRLCPRPRSLGAAGAGARGGGSRPPGTTLAIPRFGGEEEGEAPNENEQQRPPPRRSSGSPQPDGCAVRRRPPVQSPTGVVVGPGRGDSRCSRRWLRQRPRVGPTLPHRIPVRAAISR